MFTLTNSLLVITATTTALIAGLLYGYSCSVNLGLGRLPDAEYLAAMQSINSAIQNPLFFASFLGSLLLLPLSTYLHYAQPASTRFWFLLAATTVYLLTVFGVTVLGNVPLNEALESFNLPQASSDDIAIQRARFEKPWNYLHTMRTIGATLTIVLVIIACLYPKLAKVD
ncbi:MAG: anthrone oxygenase family protein [Bacteroidota bacterium]